MTAYHYERELTSLSTVQSGHVAMTFEEIAAVMGTNPKNVYMAYKRAMFKIRRNPVACAALREIVRARASERDKPTHGTVRVMS